MSFILAQHGTALSILNNSSGAITAITLPTGVTISSARPPRFTIWKREVIMANAASQIIAVNKDAQSRILTPRAPSTAPVISGTGSGGLSGAYLVKCSFIVKDFFGNLLAESGLSPVSNSATLSSNFLLAESIPISPDTITARRLYRTVAGGTSVFFPWIDVDGNTVQSTQNDLSDTALQLISAPDDLGNQPDATLITEWKGRLWAVDRNLPDFLRRTSAGFAYTWNPDLVLEVAPIGADLRGCTALLPRKNELGVGKYNSLSFVTGDSDDDYTVVQFKKKIGVLSQEASIVVDDVGYFLGNPFGFYRWDDGGVDNLSDDKVKGWFATDTYFNRSRFQYATLNWDSEHAIISCHLSATGSSTNDRWFYYDVRHDEFYGPHKTGEFTPTCSGPIILSTEVEVPVIGSSNGFLWKPQSTRTDGDSTAIDMDVDSPYHAGEPGVPQIDKYFSFLTLITKILASGTLTVTPKVGGLNASAGTAMSHDMTLGTESLDRLGFGQFVQLNFRQNTTGIDCVIYGYEIPYHELGRRTHG